MSKVIKSSLYKELYKFNLFYQKVQDISPPGTLSRNTDMNY